MRFNLKKKIIKLLVALTLFFNHSTKAGIADYLDFGYNQPVYAHAVPVAKKKENNLKDFAQDQEKMLDACLKNNWMLFFELYKKYEETPHLLRQLCNSSEGPTPLLWATLSDNSTMVRLLLKKADPVNIFNQSVLYWAARLEYKEIVQILLDAGFTPDQSCKHYHKSLSSRTLRAKQIKQIITRLHQNKKQYIESFSPLKEAHITLDKVIAPMLIQADFNLKKARLTEDDVINEIDCDLSASTALIITACPFLIVGALYLFELYRLSESNPLPLALDMTNYQ